MRIDYESVFHFLCAEIFFRARSILFFHAEHRNLLAYCSCYTIVVAGSYWLLLAVTAVAVQFRVRLHADFSPMTAGIQ